MELTLIAITLSVYWLLRETDYLRVRLLVGRYGYMLLPSGTVITKEDYDFMVNLIKPPKVTKPATSPCWYCRNGHDRQRIDLGVHSFDLCECGASILPLLKRRTRKASPYAAMAKEIGARFAPYHQANVKKMKQLI